MSLSKKSDGSVYMSLLHSLRMSLDSNSSITHECSSDDDEIVKMIASTSRTLILDFSRIILSVYT